LEGGRGQTKELRGVVEGGGRRWCGGLGQFLECVRGRGGGG